MSEKNDYDVLDSNIKRKKGRPRKEFSNKAENVNVEEKKKRGRKKKEVVIEEVKPRKKRGRKAAVKYFSSSIRKKIPLTTVLQDNNNYILYLDIKDENEEQVVETDTLISPLQENKSGNILMVTPNNNVNNTVNDTIDNIFEKMKKENEDDIKNLQQDYENLLNDEEYIMNDTDCLTELYEKRCEHRETQDNQMIDNLEKMHKNYSIIDKIFLNEQKQELKNDDYKVTQEENRKRGYFELLKDFIENDTWIHKTNVCCWWCCNTFDTVPIGLPEKYIDSIDKFRVKGIFCSFSCMIAYRNNEKGDIKDFLINFLYSKITGTPLINIDLQPAPPRCSLKMFGGDLSIDEFRNSFKEERIYKMIQYPMFICKEYIEEIDIKNLKRVNYSVFTEGVQNKVANLDNKIVEDAKSRLLQIEQSTITLGNTIDKFIKIS